MERCFVEKVVDGNNIPFDPLSYSRFKHGSRHIAIKYGKALARKLISERLIDLEKDTRILITGAPYNQVPVASTALAMYVAQELRKSGFTKVVEFKINREHSYHQDYGLMSVEERKKSITGESFYTDAKFLENEHVIFVDDILITGAHESRIIDMIHHLEIKPKSTCFAYYAILEQGCCSPQIEHDLNSAALEDIDEIIEVFSEDALLMNTRAVKYVLSLSEKDFNKVWPWLSTSVLSDMYRYAIGNNYNTHEYYITNFKILDTIIHGLNKKIEHV